MYVCLRQRELPRFHLLKRIGEIMKKIMLGLGLLVLLACGPTQDQAEGTATLGNPDPMSVACASGFTRTLPRYCANNFSASTPFQNAVSDNTCRSLTWAFLPSSATRARIGITLQVKSNNSIGLRTLTFNAQQNTGCTVNAENAYLSIYEHVAVVANTEIGNVQIFLDAPLFSTATYYKSAIIGAGSTSTAGVTVYGYWD